MYKMQRIIYESIQLLLTSLKPNQLTQLKFIILTFYERININ